MRVVFSTSNRPGALIIRAGTLSRWSHVDLMGPDGTLIGATAALGVHRTTLEQRLRDNHCTRYRVDEILLPDEDVAWGFAESQLGKPYDFGAVVGFALPFRKDWDDTSRWFCSELVASACSAGGVVVARLDLNRVTPGYLDRSPLLRTVEPERRVG